MPVRYVAPLFPVACMCGERRRVETEEFVDEFNVCVTELEAFTGAEFRQASRKQTPSGPFHFFYRYSAVFSNANRL